jgi:hypothetical protein
MMAQNFSVLKSMDIDVKYKYIVVKYMDSEAVQVDIELHLMPPSSRVNGFLVLLYVVTVQWDHLMTGLDDHLMTGLDDHLMTGHYGLTLFFRVSVSVVFIVLWVI